MHTWEGKGRKGRDMFNGWMDGSMDGVGYLNLNLNLNLLCSPSLGGDVDRSAIDDVYVLAGIGIGHIQWEDYRALHCAALHCTTHHTRPME